MEQKNSKQIKDSQFLCGAAVRDISPTKGNGMLPLYRKSADGYRPIVDVIDPIHVRCIALSDGSKTMLMLSFETGRSPYPKYFAAALAEHVGLPEDAIFFTATHSHAAPEITTEIDTSDDYGQRLQVWADYVTKQMFAAADEAIVNLQPAEASIGYSDSYVNVNRNALYTVVEEDYIIRNYRYLGYNGAGMSDKSLVTVRFDDMQDRPIAFIVTYAVHGTVMHFNKCIDGEMGLSADIPGAVSTHLENKFTGAVALWLSGAAGDQNPIVMNEMYTANPDSGEFETTYIENGSVEILDYLGRIQFADVMRSLSVIEKMNNEVKISYGFGVTSVPGRSVTVINDEVGHFEYEYGEGEDFLVSLQLFRIGSIGFIGCAGELFSSIGVYLKEHALLKDIIIVNHAALSYAQAANYYLPDDESMENGGFAALSAEYKPGYLQEALVILTNSLINESND